jgi:hypothetical protein
MGVKNKGDFFDLDAGAKYWVHATITMCLKVQKAQNHSGRHSGTVLSPDI